MATIPDGDWACITDWDVLFLLPETITHMHGYIERFPDTALFTCYASRSHVNSVGQMLPTGCSSVDSIIHHTNLARLQTKHLYEVTELNRVVSGYVMLISKETWKKYPFAQTGECLGVDSDFSKRLYKDSLKVRRMDGIYVWHTYRMYSDVKDTSHLKPAPEEKTVYTAIFSPYEKLKEPRIVSKGWKYICYTDQPIKSKVWEVRQVIRRHECPRREARMYKALFYQYVDTEFSLWIDGSFQINCNLHDLWKRLYKGPFTAPQHPSRNCVYEEIRSAVSAGRGGCELIYEQGEHYRSLGIPPKNGIITSGVLLRQKVAPVMALCEAWWNETNKWSLRDQVSFANVSRGVLFHTVKWEYNKSRELIYIKHSDPLNKKP